LLDTTDFGRTAFPATLLIPADITRIRDSTGILTVGVVSLGMRGRQKRGLLSVAVGCASDREPEASALPTRRHQRAWS
jgi:hypothetical protein